MSGFVVVDASLAFKWLVREEHTDKAMAILRAWQSEDVIPAAPHLLPFEVSNALHGKALETASRFRQTAAYDAHYLALADSLDCELWTADEKFYRSVRQEMGHVRWIGEFGES